MVKLNSIFDGEIRTSGLPDLREAAPRSRWGGPNVVSTGRYVKNGANLNVRQFTQIVNMN